MTCGPASGAAAAALCVVLGLGLCRWLFPGPRPPRPRCGRLWKPPQPALVALLNAAGRALEGCGVRKTFTAGSLLRDARNREGGLADFGDRFWLERLEVLVEDTHASNDFAPLGRLFRWNAIVRNLGSVLRLNDLFKKHPGIADVQLGRLVVIAGLPRTGTTALHRYLACDERIRSIPFWEAQFPVPLPGERGAEKRKVMGRRLCGVARYLCPELFDTIHPTEWDQAEEDTLFLEHTFSSGIAESVSNVERFSKHLETADYVPVYRHVRRVLQLLLWQRPVPSNTMVLKAPCHMEHLDALLAVFPSAVVIQIHREPSQSLPSLLSMNCHLHALYSGTVDPDAVTRHWTAKARRMLAKAAETRERHPESFVDVAFRDLVRDPVSEVRRIYARAGLPASETAENAVREQAALYKAKGKKNGHDYSLADFGLTKEGVDTTFEEYRTQFAKYLA